MSKIKKVKASEIELIEKEDQFWTTSLDIAEKFGKRHNNVIRDIENLDLPDDFQLLNFEQLERPISGGTQKYYIISRDGFSLLGMGFTGKKALEWKLEYIKAFNQMEAKIISDAKQLRRQSNKEWRQLRDDGKTARKTVTDVYKDYGNYMRSQGSSADPDKAYIFLTQMVYDACIIPGGRMEILNRKKELKIKNGRDTLAVSELMTVRMMEEIIVPKVIKDTIESGEFYKKAYKSMKEKIMAQGERWSRNLLPEMV